MKMSKSWRRWCLGALVAVVPLSLLGAWFGPAVVVEFDLHRARRAIARNDFSDALAWLHAAEARDAERADVQFLLGVINRRAEKYLPATRNFERALALGWSKREVLAQRAMLRFQMGFIGDAGHHLAKLLDRGCDEALAEEIYEAMVIGYLAEYRVGEAMAILQRWLAVRSNSVRAHVLLANLYGAMADPEHMQAELREVLRLDPGLIHERLWLAQSLREGNRVEEALAECEVCRRQAPRDADVMLGTGLCHFQLGHPKEAQPELEAAVAKGLNPQHRLQALVALGQIAMDDSQFEQAARYYERAVETVPADSAAEYGLGTALSKLEKRDMAEPHLRRWRVLETQTARLAEINRLLAISADDVPMRLEAAGILQSQGYKSEAAQWMMSVLRYNPRQREAHELLAQYFEEQGKSDLAGQHRAALRDENAGIQP
jgi:tetratricopeptide (TPR) repeat protein